MKHLTPLVIALLIPALSWAAQPVTVAGPNGTTATVTAGNALQTDASATTQPVSAASLPLPTGAATSALQTTINTTLGTPMQNSGGSVTANLGSPQAVTPVAGTAHAIVTGGTAVTMVTGPVKGCYVTNPTSATDQGIVTAENAYVNPVTTATTTGNGTNATLAPGQSFYCPAGMTTNVSVNAATSSHALTVVTW